MISENVLKSILTSHCIAEYIINIIAISAFLANKSKPAKLKNKDRFSARILNYKQAFSK